MQPVRQNSLLSNATARPVQSARVCWPVWSRLALNRPFEGWAAPHLRAVRVRVARPKRSPANLLKKSFRPGEVDKLNYALHGQVTRSGAGAKWGMLQIATGSFNRLLGAAQMGMGEYQNSHVAWLSCQGDVKTLFYYMVKTHDDAYHF